MRGHWVQLLAHFREYRLVTRRQMFCLAFMGLKETFQLIANIYISGDST